MRYVFRVTGTIGSVIAAAALIAVQSMVLSVPEVQVRPVHLMSADSVDSTLGGGTALIMGPSGTPLPPQSFVDAVDALYLQPLGFTGTAQALFTPESLGPQPWPTDFLPMDTSVHEGVQALETAVLQHIDSGSVDAAHPLVIFGWSQSATIASLAMQDFANEGVPSDYLHFVLVGNPNTPNGGAFVALPPGTVEGTSFNDPTPVNLYPTDIYINEYDPAGAFPRYPIDLLSFLNVESAMTHGLYLVHTPEEIASAIQLPTSMTDTLTNYYVISSTILPLLAPLQQIPVIGRPLYDLLEPATRILVNLGYGSITDGWNQGDADVPIKLGVFPTDSATFHWSDVLPALANAVPQGISAALKDLQDPATYQLTTPAYVSQMHEAMYIGGHLDTPSPSMLELWQANAEKVQYPISDATLHSPPTDIVNDLTAMLNADYAALTAALSGNSGALETALQGTLISLIHFFDLGSFFNLGSELSM